MKKQVILIHGGEVFETDRKYLASLKKETLDIEALTKGRTRKWKETLGEKLGSRFEVLYPEMPNNRWNNKYSEWKIWFEKLKPLAKDGVVLIGHSLGGIFLAKYLSENAFPKKIRAVVLVAAPYIKKKKGRPNYFGGFGLNDDLSFIAEQAKCVYIYHSKDDPVVPFSHAKMFGKNLPDARIITFKNRGHFTLKSFPELVKAVRALSIG